MRALSTQGPGVRARLAWAILGIVGLLALVIIGSALDRSSVVAGPNGSSYVTTGNGTAALYEVLERDGRRPIRLRTTLDGSTLDSIGTLLVIEPGSVGYAPSEVAAIERWTSDGGRLVVVGRPPPGLDPLTEEGSRRWSTHTVDAGDTFLPARLQTSTGRFGSFESVDGVVDWITGTSGTAATVARKGFGWVVMVADLGLVSNDGLGAADNARVALTLIGPGPVAFDEVRHGFEDREAVGIIEAAPGNWEAALVVLGVTVAVGLISYGRRLGPPEPSRRHLIPGRAAFLESLGDALAATGDLVEIARPIRTMARRMIRSRADSDDPDSLFRSARSLGLTRIEFNAVYDDGEGTVYTAQRALSKLQNHPTGGPT